MNIDLRTITFATLEVNDLGQDLLGPGHQILEIYSSPSINLITRMPNAAPQKNINAPGIIPAYCGIIAMAMIKAPAERNPYAYPVLIFCTSCLCKCNICSDRSGLGVLCCCIGNKASTPYTCPFHHMLYMSSCLRLYVFRCKFDG